MTKQVNAADPGVELVGEAWMELENPRMTMDEAVEKLKALGNEVLEVDEEGRRVKVLDEELSGVEGVVFACDNPDCSFAHPERAEALKHEEDCL